jgi:hypothetical protein
MTIETDALRDDLRAWLKSPAIGLPEYSADLQVQRRVGKMIANCGAENLPRAQQKLAVSSIRPHLPSKP